jgi:hypothetical protein
MPSSEGRGSSFLSDKPVSDRNYIKRFLSDTFFIKEGMVIDIFPSKQLCQVNYGGGTTEAIWLTKSYPGLFSCIDNLIPTIGTRVLLYKDYGSNPAIILGCLPRSEVHYGNSLNIENSKIDTATEEHFRLPDNSPLDNYSSDVPQDLFPGEWVIMNELGGLLGLLKGMAIIKATDLAQIQLSLIDNMVRIVSGSTFEHISAAHETAEYNNKGFLSIENDYYEKQHEMFGVENGQDISQKGEYYIKEPRQDLEPKPIMKLHVGHIGDIMKFYIIKHENNIPITLALIEANKEGKISIQSVNELEMSIKKKLFMPQRVHPYNKEKEIEQEKLDPFEYNESYSKDQQDKDKQLWDTKRAQNNYRNQNWAVYETEENENESSFSLRKDGSFCLSSNGNIFSIDKQGNTTLSCLGDFNIKCGGSLNALVSKDINLKPKGDCDIDANEGHVRVAAKESCIVRTEEQGILLETNSVTTEENRFSGIVGRCLKESSITMESKLNVSTIAGKNIVNIADNNIRQQCVNIEIDASSVVYKAKEDFYLETQKTQIKTSEYLNNFDYCEMLGVNFIISGTASGKIHGGKATDINHVHPRNEWKYKGDPCGGMHGVFIEKQNRGNNKSPEEKTIDDVSNLMEPYTKTYIEQIKYKFREAPYENYIYEDFWQEGMQWNLLQNEINNTCSFPGKQYNLYYKYSPNKEAQKESGKFVNKNITSYGG